ncbi:DNA-directed RNA polymerase I subunit RPA12 [Eurosta solidaginis]|uniref:DNA-directed RNA polymerase I subunit RPA12 n=1 Tax=Eurosta solidaginis TaxID=178769 RepID=UPI00353174BB
METFNSEPGFCPVCGSILPLMNTVGNVVCYNCRKEFPPEVFGAQEVEYTIHFNSYDPGKVSAKTKIEANEAEGPIVERKCPKCGHMQMSYATLQLRSADEGQTVFFTCLKCKFKESENS